MDNSTDNRRIAKNTAFLYIRMLLVLIVGLLTSRVVLNTLGVEDYGIYNVVGGFVVFFGFINGAMANASQRFITFELANGNINKQIATFSTSINLHILLAIIIIFFAETIGLWFLNNKLVIPYDRMHAAFWVYQVSIATLVLSVLSVPYNALIIAHEKMSAFALISITDVLLKLIIVYFLTIISYDRLIFYSVLLFGIQFLDRIIYGIYCRTHFPEANYHFIFDKGLFKGMSNIAGWSIFGNIAGVGYTQGINILLNIFFGPAINAARGIAVTIQGVVSGFVSNIQMAINPQITKSYATGNLKRMHSLIYSSSKFCFYLLLIIIMPIIIETHTILVLWLKLVPQHTVWFSRLILIILLFDTLANPLMIASQAVGKVKAYQSIVGSCLLFILPISYLSLKCGAIPESVFIVQLTISLVAIYLRIVIVSKLINMNIHNYIQLVIRPIIIVFIISLFLGYGLSYTINYLEFNKLFTLILTPFLIISVITIIGLTSGERNILFEKVKSFTNSIINHFYK